MKKSIYILIIILLSIVSNGFSQDFIPDVPKSYVWNISNQWDAVSAERLIQNNGMSRRFLSQKTLNNYSSTLFNQNGRIRKVNLYLKQIEFPEGYSLNNFGSSFNNWDGLQLKWQWKNDDYFEDTRNEHNIVGRFNVSDAVQLLEGNAIKNQIFGAGINYNFSSGKAKKWQNHHSINLQYQDRSLTLIDSKDALNTEQGLLNYQFHSEKSLNLNHKILLGFNTQSYFGHFTGTIVNYEGCQLVNSIFSEMSNTYRKMKSTSHLTVKNLMDYQDGLLHQTTLDLKNNITFKVNKPFRKASFNFVNRLVAIPNQIIYAPGVEIFYHVISDEMTLKFAADRDVHQITNTLEFTPYLIQETPQIRNVIIDAAHLMHNWTFHKKYVIRNNLNYQNWRNFQIVGLNTMQFATYDIYAHRILYRFNRISASYKNRIFSDGDLAELIPKHTFLVQFEGFFDKDKSISKRLKMSRLNYYITPGFRSGSSSLDYSGIQVNALQDIFFTDLGIESFFNWQKRKGCFYHRRIIGYVKVRNIANSATIEPSENHNAALLFSDGIRSPRSFHVGIRIPWYKNH